MERSRRRRREEAPTRENSEALLVEQPLLAGASRRATSRNDASPSINADAPPPSPHMVRLRAGGGRSSSSSHNNNTQRDGPPALHVPVAVHPTPLHPCCVVVVASHCVASRRTRRTRTYLPACGTTRPCAPSTTPRGCTRVAMAPGRCECWPRPRATGTDASGTRKPLREESVTSSS